jgi:hypothetical protein
MPHPTSTCTNVERLGGLRETWKKSKGERLPKMEVKQKPTFSRPKLSVTALGQSKQILLVVFLFYLAGIVP